MGEADQGSWPAIECNAARVAIRGRPAECSERFALQDITSVSLKECLPGRQKTR